MFVRIEFMYGSKGDLHTDTYVREFPDFTMEQVTRQLAYQPFPVKREGADPDKYIWPSAIISVSECNERGYTKHNIKHMGNKDF